MTCCALFGPSLVAVPPSPSSVTLLRLRRHRRPQCRAKPRPRGLKPSSPMPRYPQARNQCGSRAPTRLCRRQTVHASPTVNANGTATATATGVDGGPLAHPTAHERPPNRSRRGRGRRTTAPALMVSSMATRTDPAAALAAETVFIRTTQRERCQTSAMRRAPTTAGHSKRLQSALRRPPARPSRSLWP
ncbi:hypothetical protein BD626DRAFT_483948 [Schizophyllum amplum]|uniref:Uncharacterized protein n=1 Tax=Schizophyllum amplum TaxID=97359 RepID=A0A550CPY1_9AGAR|nr:hypothetical protein BD626DRAFT_483948 [Auriculariopsis ampla]